MVVQKSGMVIHVKLSQFVKQPIGIDINNLGSSTLLRFLQFAKTCSPSCFFHNTIKKSKFVQPRNAHLSTLVIVFGILTLVIFLQF